MDVVAESGGKDRSPRVSPRFSLGVENARADVGRDGQTCPPRHTILRRERNRLRQNSFNFLSELSTSRRTTTTNY